MSKKSIHLSYSLQSGLNHSWWQSSGLFALAGLGTVITWAIVSGGGESQSLPPQSLPSAEWQVTAAIPEGLPETQRSIIPDLPEVEKAIQKAETQKALLSARLPLPAPILDGRSLLRERLQSLPPPASPIRFARPEPLPLRPVATKPQNLAIPAYQQTPIQRRVETSSPVLVQHSIPSGVVENRGHLAKSPPRHRPNPPSFAITRQPIKLSRQQPQTVAVLPQNLPFHALEGQITVQNSPELGAGVVVKNSGQDSSHFVVVESLKMAHRLNQNVDEKNLRLISKNGVDFANFSDNPLVLVQQFGMNLEQIQEAVDPYQAQRQWLLYLREDGIEDDLVI
ncbi:hypothetical protein [Spirulina subsalsa]|uniref:hypothetical protein n=1 Tax=Spirulina subsalsa TaxID=54311 RepID=UPI00031928B4|nr:hypothetical protein [Spirulina subsalsa]